MHMPFIYGADKGSVNKSVGLCVRNSHTTFLPSSLILKPYFLILKKDAVWIFHSQSRSRSGSKSGVYLLTDLLKTDNLNLQLGAPSRDPSPPNTDSVWNGWICLTGGSYFSPSAREVDQDNQSGWAPGGMGIRVHNYIHIFSASQIDFEYFYIINVVHLWRTPFPANPIININSRWDNREKTGMDQKEEWC